MTRADFCIERKGGQRIVGEHLEGAAPGYLFLHGLGSTRIGEKSDSLLAWAEAHGRACTRFDARGHGDSSGKVGEVKISDLVDDAVLLLERNGPTIVVGSSMGGMVGAFATARRPDLVTGLCLIAPAFGFLHRLERTLDQNGHMWTTDGRSFPLSDEVIEDARSFDESALPRQLDLPVLIVHGDRDEVVPHRRSQRFFSALPNPRKELWIVEGGDHRLNTVTQQIWRRLDDLLLPRAPEKA